MGLIPNFGRGRKSDGKGKSMIARPGPIDKRKICKDLNIPFVR